MTASFQPYILQFKQASGTSRGILHTKETYILEISENGKTGIGECPLFRGLSSDDVPSYEEKLQWLCNNIQADKEFIHRELLPYPSIWFGYEQAILNLKFGSDLYFPSKFTDGDGFIKINGLIWMGDAGFMEKQIEEKLANGFNCLKLKIGIDWGSEREILKKLRSIFSKNQLELRVDANGAFNFTQAKKVLQELADLEIHSIEQPIKAVYKDIEGHWKEKSLTDIAKLCEQSPTPIALDEELIGVFDEKDKISLLEIVKPQFIILKPALVGGFSGSNEWIAGAEKNKIGWWITSALESNIGLNAIAQYTFTKQSPIPQGLGTGALFTNNFKTRMKLLGDHLVIS